MSEHVRGTFDKKIQDDYKRRRSLWSKIDGDMLYGAAARAIGSKGASFYVLCIILSKQTIPPKARERKRLEKVGLWPPKEAVNFSFPVREARHLGLSEKTLLRALQVLSEVGFIDRISTGSADRRGNFAEYRLSDRWVLYGMPGFHKRKWEKAQAVGVNDKGGTGKFLPTRSRKAELAATVTATKPDSAVTSTATNSPVAVTSTAERAESGGQLAVTSTVFLSVPILTPSQKVVF